MHILAILAVPALTRGLFWVEWLSTELLTSRSTVRSLFLEPTESLTLYLVLRFPYNRIQIQRKYGVLLRSKHTRATC